MLLLVDDAERLSAPALEELSLLNAEALRGKSLLQTLLFSGDELPGLSDGSNRDLFQSHVCARAVLRDLDYQDTRRYVLHRLKRTGWRDDPAFDDGALAAIHAGSKGRPAHINRICDWTLRLGCRKALHVIHADHVGEAVQRLMYEGALAKTATPKGGHRSARTSSGRGSSDTGELLARKLEQLDADIASLLGSEGADPPYASGDAALQIDIDD